MTGHPQIGEDHPLYAALDRLSDLAAGENVGTQITPEDQEAFSKILDHCGYYNYIDKDCSDE